MERLIPYMTPRSKAQILPLLAIWVGVFAALDHIMLSIVYGSQGGSLFALSLTSTLVFTPFCGVLLWIAWRKASIRQKLIEMNTIDPLTQLPNRTHFFRSVMQRDWLQGGSLCIFSIDDFRKVNDIYGHRTGDACLTAVATLLPDMLPVGSLVGRISGSEFGAVLPPVPVSHLRKLSKELAKGAPFAKTEEDEVLSATVTMGAAIYDGEMDLSILLGKADAAVQLARSDDDARLVVWDKVYSTAA